MLLPSLHPNCHSSCFATHPSLTGFRVISYNHNLHNQISRRIQLRRLTIAQNSVHHGNRLQK
ncbi:hypothetical protein FD19_GL001890 [Lacticaseibacillus thailandensis DSM 22698 = JCM 13996]|uniref:Uncharacterized protein n=1 Tax=Lacticaseibacillus thailandensis DSM 22698 = JCM 13996 TaxID=1423810 RepID=A0A0R2C4P5_9LACO|nr:hypothetical protein FD19_GL001890 [Lacticaseibacillus thailandensis DSM 22698 = JCM 13996]